MTVGSSPGVTVVKETREGNDFGQTLNLNTELNFFFNHWYVMVNIQQVTWWSVSALVSSGDNHCHGQNHNIQCTVI